MSNLREARVEAAARAWFEGSPTPNNWENMTPRLKDIHRTRMRAALAAADAVVTKEQIAGALRGATDEGANKAEEYAEAVLVLLRGEVADDE